MAYSMVIKLIICFFLFGQFAAAQTGNLYLRAGLGLQSPVAGKTYAEWRMAQVRNNVFYAVIANYAGLEYRLNKRHAVYAEICNGLAGYSVGTRHKDDCGNPGAGYSERGLSTALSYNRIIAGHIWYPTYKKRDKFHINIALQYGLGIDFYIPENAGIVFFPGVNRCGEEFYLRDTVFNIRKTGLVLPLQVNFQAYTKKRMSVCLSLFYHAGITRHADVNVDYITSGYTDRSRYITRGSSYGFRVSYPLRLFAFKQKKHEN